MKIKAIAEAGGFATDTVSKRITWKNPKTNEEHLFEVGVKRRSYGTLERVLINEDKAARCALQISECIVLEDGETFTYEQAYGLEPSLGKLLNQAVEEVNNLEKDAAAKN